jgi:hypothetical protein
MEAEYMPRGKYRPDYKKLYSDEEITQEVLDLLQKSDRRMVYTDMERKQERFRLDEEACTARFIPSREDSYERLLEHRQFSDGAEDIEAELIQREALDKLFFV